MNNTLYQITDDILKLDALFLDMVDMETGEINGDVEQIEKMQHQLHEMLENKSENIIKYIKIMEYDNEVRKQEEKRLKKLRERDEKKIESIKNYVLNNMKKLDKKSIKTSIGSLNIRKSTSTIINEKELEKDERYWKTEITDKFDKMTIKKLLQSGEVIKGAMLVENENINIK